MSGSRRIVVNGSLRESATLQPWRFAGRLALNGFYAKRALWD